MLGENGMTISERSIGVNILYGVMVILYVRREMHVSRPSENILPIRDRRFDNTTRFMVYYVSMNRKDARALTSPRLKTSEFYALSYKGYGEMSARRGESSGWATAHGRSGGCWQGIFVCRQSLFFASTYHGEQVT